MKQAMRPVTLGENSLRISLLHKALRTLGLPVSEQEEKLRLAGEDTQRQVRALQEKLQIGTNDNYMVDEATYEAIKKEMRKKGDLADENKFIVQGAVFNRSYEPVKFQSLIALDVDVPFLLADLESNVECFIVHQVDLVRIFYRFE